MTVLVFALLLTGAFGLLLLHDDVHTVRGEIAPPPPTSGNWVLGGGGDYTASGPIDVNGDVYIEDADLVIEGASITVSGAIWVNDTGFLRISDSTLTFDGSDPEENYINILRNGSMTLDNTTVTSVNTNPYWLAFWEGSDGLISNGTDVSDATSISVYSSDVRIEDSLVHDCTGDGIIAYDCTPTISNNVIGKNEGWGIYARGREPTMSGNDFTYSGSNNTDGRVLQELGARVYVHDQDGGPLSGATVSMDSIGLITGSNGLTSMTYLTLYTIANNGVETNPQYNLNASWYTGALTMYGQRSFMLKDEANMSNLSIELEIGPDLYITASDIELSTTTPKEGSKLEIEVTVHNSWSKPAYNVTVTVEGSPYTIDEYYTIPLIPANGSAVAYINWTVRTYDIGGELNITVYVDILTLVEGDEIDRSNNEASVTVDVKAEKDDGSMVGMLAGLVAVIIIVILLLVYLRMRGSAQASEPPAEVQAIEQPPSGGSPPGQGGVPPQG